MFDNFACRLRNIFGNTVFTVVIVVTMTLIVEWETQFKIQRLLTNYKQIRGLAENIFDNIAYRLRNIFENKLVTAVIVVADALKAN